MENTLFFLQDLKENNNREWFNKNKSRYEESHQKIIFLAELLINEIRQFDNDIEQQDPKKCVFRLYRDVRFSKNKNPYKNNFGIAISKNGRKSRYATYYLQIEPVNSFIGGGIFHPESKNLKILRDYIVSNADEFYSIIEDKRFKATFPQMIDDRLKTSPRDYSIDHPQIELLRYKSYAFFHPLSDDLLKSDNYLSEIIKLFKILYPVNAYLNCAFDNC